MVVEPFGPHETAEMLELPAADAIDAHLCSAGSPISPRSGGPGPVCGASWMSSFPTPPRRSSSAGSVSYLRSSRRRSGPGRCSRLSDRARGPSPRYNGGGIHETTLQRALAVLVGQKRMVSAERPLSSRAFEGDALLGRRPLPSLLAPLRRAQYGRDRARSRRPRGREDTGGLVRVPRQGRRATWYGSPSSACCPTSASGTRSTWAGTGRGRATWR